MLTEAEKALAELKETVAKEVSDKLSPELAKEVAGVVTKDVMEQVATQLKDIKKPELSADEASKERATKAVGAFQQLYNKQVLNKDLDTATSGAGSEIIADYFGTEVIRVAESVGTARANARVITLPGKTFKLPGFGNVTAYRTDEGSAYTASGLSTSQLAFSAKKLTALVIMTKETIEDANVDVLDWVVQLAGEALAKKEDQWAFLGLSAGEGIFQKSGVPAKVMSSGDTGYTDVTFDYLLDMLNLVDDNLVKSLVWLGSFSIFNTLRRVKDSNGNYIYQNPGAGMPNAIWDLPYKFSTVMPKATDASQANKAFLAVYDPRYLMIGDRRTVEVEFSKEATVTSSDGSTTINLFEQDMVAVKVSERLDIQIAEHTKAFAILKTAAS